MKTYKVKLVIEKDKPDSTRNIRSDYEFRVEEIESQIRTGVTEIAFESGCSAVKA